MRAIDRSLLTHFLPKLLRRACPSTVHRSGADGLRVNCFTTTLPDGDQPGLVLLSIDGERIECLKFDGNSYSVAMSITLDAVDASRIQVTHYYGLDELRYEGIWAIAPGIWTGWPYAAIHLRRMRNAIAQQLFNRRTLEVQRRLDVLRQVVQATADGTTAVDAMDLMTRRYGDRWAGHPDWREHHRVLERNLEFLADTGELQKVAYDFRPTGQALKTLEDCEEADRKHSANLRVQLLLAVLTFLSAAMAAAQAGLLRLPTLFNLTDKAVIAAEPWATSRPTSPANAPTLSKTDTVPASVPAPAAVQAASRPSANQ